MPVKAEPNSSVISGATASSGGGEEGYEEAYAKDFDDSTVIDPNMSQLIKNNDIQ